MHLNTFKNNWGNFLVKKDIESLLSLYDEKFIFKGTFASNTTQNNKKMSDYFLSFSNDVKKVEFLSNDCVIKQDKVIINSGKYKFHTINGIIKAEYQFVFRKLEKEYKIVSHFSFLSN